MTTLLIMFNSAWVKGTGGVVPGADLGPIAGLVDQTDSSDPQEVDGNVCTIYVHDTRIGLDGSAKVVLDLVGLEYASIALGIAHIGTTH